MMYGNAPYFLLLVFSSLLSLGILAYTIFQRRTPGSTPLFAIFLLAFLCPFSYIWEITTDLIAWKLFWLHVRQAATHLLPVAVMILSIRISGNDNWYNKKLLLLVSIIPIVFSGLIFTNESHGLLYSGVILSTVDNVSFVEVARTPLAWVGIGYSYLLIVCSLFFLLVSYMRSPYPFRRQYPYIAFSLLLPSVTMMVDIAGANPLAPFVTTPLIIFVSGIALAIAMFRYHMLKIWPIARYKVFEYIRHGIMITDPAGRLVDINPEAKRILKHSLKFSEVDNWPGQPLEPLIQAWPEWLRAYSQKGNQQLEIQLKDDAYYEVNIEPMLGRHGHPIGHLTFLYDVSNRKQIEKKLHIQATTDYLTGVMNRRSFMEFAKQEFLLSVRYGKPYSLLMIDLDHFKQINDVYGHYVGDLVLKRFARQCKSCLRESDIFARVGGEEFAVALPETPLEGARAVAEKIRRLIESEEVNVEGRHIHYTISIGIATRQETDLSFDSILLRADTVLYKAKQFRNSVFTQ